MSIKKRAARLVTIPDFLKEHPAYTENQVRHALRNRHENGLGLYVFRREHLGNPLVLDADRVAAWFERTVRA